MAGLELCGENDGCGYKNLSGPTGVQTKAAVAEVVDSETGEVTTKAEPEEGYYTFSLDPCCCQTTAYNLVLLMFQTSNTFNGIEMLEYAI